MSKLKYTVGQMNNIMSSSLEYFTNWKEAEKENKRLTARIAELESVIDQLIEVSEKMFTAVIAAADSYDEGMRVWDKIVNDWKEG